MTVILPLWTFDIRKEKLVQALSLRGGHGNRRRKVTTYIAPTVRKQREDAGAQLSVTLLWGWVLPLPLALVRIPSWTQRCVSVVIPVRLTVNYHRLQSMFPFKVQKWAGQGGTHLNFQHSVVEAGRSGVEGHSWLHFKFKSNLCTCDPVSENKHNISNNGNTQKLKLRS